jgi:MOSC domain-containing protein YiiM
MNENENTCLEAQTQAPAVLRDARIRHLFISPGHNFYGHQGQPAGEHPMIEVGQIECVAGHGVRGDRFFDYKEDYKGQITFFAWETLAALRRELNLPGAQPSAPRRNVVLEGIDLPSLIGRQFELQGVRFAGTEESRPCHWMNGALGPGAQAWLQGRGGLRARILTDGILRIAPRPGTA